jgi:hypothetical protein
MCFYSPANTEDTSRTTLQRKLYDLQEILDYVQENGINDVAHVKLQQVFDHDQVESKEEWAEWLRSERQYHLRQYKHMLHH